MNEQQFRTELNSRIEEMGTVVKSDFDFIRIENCSAFFESDPKPQEYLISNFLPKLSVGLIAGWGGVGKSWLTMQLGMCVASGIPFLKEGFEIPRMGKVVFLNAEDDKNEQHRRFRAIYENMCNGFSQSNREIEAETLKAKLKERFHFIPVAGKGRIRLGDENDGDCQKAIIEEIKKLGDVSLVILDPANRLTDANFNSTEEITRFIQALDEIHHQTGATCLLVTHVNKASAEGITSSPSVIGSHAFVNATRWVMIMASMTGHQAKKLKIEPEEMRSYACIDLPKANYLPAGKVNKFWVKRTETGVLEPVYFETDVDDLLHFLEVLNAHSGTPKTKLIKTLTKETDFSERWVRKKIQELIKGKILIVANRSSGNSWTKVCTVDGTKLEKYRRSVAGEAA